MLCIGQSWHDLWIFLGLLSTRAPNPSTPYEYSTRAPSRQSAGVAMLLTEKEARSRGGGSEARGRMISPSLFLGLLQNSSNISQPLSPLSHFRMSFHFMCAERIKCYPTISERILNGIQTHLIRGLSVFGLQLGSMIDTVWLIQYESHYMTSLWSQLDWIFVAVITPSVNNEKQHPKIKNIKAASLSLFSSNSFKILFFIVY